MPRTTPVSVMNGFIRFLLQPLFDSSQSNASSASPSILRSQVAALLSEVPGAKLQLFNFREMFEKRYHNSIGVSDLYKMREIVAITEEDTGLFIFLKMSPPTAFFIIFSLLVFP